MIKFTLKGVSAEAGKFN